MFRPRINPSSLITITPLSPLRSCVIIAVVILIANSYVAKHIDEQSCYVNYAAYQQATKKSCYQQTENAQRASKKWL